MNQKHINELIGTALAIEAEDARSAGMLGFVARVLAQVTLPHSKPTGNEFTRRNGNLELTVWSPKSVGLPYGSIPRLLLSWMTTEAVRARSPVLELGPTLSAFMAELGLARHGGERGDITRLRNQMVRLFSSTVSCRYTDKTHDAGSGFLIAEKYDLWWNPKAPDETPLWKSTITLGNSFFNEIVDRPIPVDMRALQELKRSPLALDIYCWLTHRMSYLRKDTVIPWPLLQLQFGVGYAEVGQGPRDFKTNFRKQLRKVHVIYPQAKVAEVEQGLFLKPSPPHVAKLPEPLGAWESRRHAAAVIRADDASTVLATGLPKPPAICLNLETYAKAKRAAPGWDVYVLEHEWRDWIARKGEPPKNPDTAFIGFCRRKAQQKTT